MLKESETTMVSYVRAREARIVAHPDTGLPFVPDRRRPYRSDDPVVLAHPDLFVSDSDLADEHEVEQATQAPGERRAVRRKRTDAAE